MTPLELYSSKKHCQDDYGNIFAPNYLLINDLKRIAGADFLFLKKVKAPSSAYFLYCVCNTETNIVKFGQSSNPHKRISNHVNNFVSYGGANIDNLYCIWSRRPFHQDSNIEKELINEFKSSYKCPQIAQEFFAQISPLTIESFFCDFITRNAFKTL